MVEQRLPADLRRPCRSQRSEILPLQAGEHQLRQIARTGEMPRGVEPVGIGIAGITEPELLCAPVHQAHEGGDATRGMLRQCKRGVVAGGKHQPQQQLPHRIAQIRPQIHGRAFHRAVALLHLDELVRSATFQTDQRGHQLRRAGHRQRFVRVVLIEHRPILRHQDACLGTAFVKGHRRRRSAAQLHRQHEDQRDRFPLNNKHHPSLFLGSAYYWQAYAILLRFTCPSACPQKRRSCPSPAGRDQ